MTAGNPLTLERAMLARQAQAELLVLAGGDEEHDTRLFDRAAERGFREPLEGEEYGANLSLYALRVIDLRTGELVTTVGSLFFGREACGLTHDRRNAIRTALRETPDSGWDWDAQPDGPPSPTDLQVQEIWR